MYELDEAVQVFRGHLYHCQYVLMMLSCSLSQAHRLILLIKVIYISIQDLHE